MAAPWSPDHVFDFLKDDPTHDIEEFEEELEEEPEEEPKEEQEEEAEDVLGIEKRLSELYLVSTRRIIPFCLGELYHFAWEKYTIFLGEVYQFFIGRSIAFAWEKYTSFPLGEVYNLLGRSIPVFHWEKYTSLLRRIIPLCLENGTTRTKKYEELSVAEKLQADCDLKATNIFFRDFHRMFMPL
ncbi:hypothetical protein Tco_0772787 [Tanacetum coccineum]|uniref:Uncharacterized protein n=1 Tax=Tanacetum coccineum TaxID=301880 RepID=A0ABQ4ZLG2_9ASTR